MTTSRRKLDREFLDRVELAKLDALKELAYGASHEINNPLANISARAQALLRDEVDPERRRALEAIHQQALRAHEMIADLMLFARPPRLERKPVDLPTIVENLIAELAPECRRRDIIVKLSVEPDLPAIMADAVQIAVAVKGLFTNAMDAIGRGGQIDVQIAGGQEATKGGRSAVRLDVRDNGPGIPADVRSHIFEPFYSGREAGRGLGFGLSKCWRIVTEHGGRLAVARGEKNGTTFSIHLPLELMS